MKGNIKHTLSRSFRPDTSLMAGARMPNVAKNLTAAKDPGLLERLVGTMKSATAPLPASEYSKHFKLNHRPPAGKPYGYDTPITNLLTRTLNKLLGGGGYIAD